MECRSSAVGHLLKKCDVRQKVQQGLRCKTVPRTRLKWCLARFCIFPEPLSRCRLSPKTLSTSTYINDMWQPSQYVSCTSLYVSGTRENHVTLQLKGSKNSESHHACGCLDGFHVAVALHAGPGRPLVVLRVRASEDIPLQHRYLGSSICFLHSRDTEGHHRNYFSF